MKLLLFLILGIIAGVIFYSIQNKPVINSSLSTNYTIPPTSSPSPSLKPTITPTKKPYISPTPTPANCNQFDPKQGLATLTVILKNKDGQPLTGNWFVHIKSGIMCPVILAAGLSSDDYYIQGQYNWTSPGFTPGKIHVDIDYHSTGQAYDIDATSGNHTIEMDVSN